MSLAAGFLQRRILTQCRNLLSYNFYSVWGPEYVEPVFRKEKLEEHRETGVLRDRAFSKIKPAESSQNCNELYDPVVTKFTNYLMRRHQDRTLAREIIRKTFEKIKRIQLNKYHDAETQEEKDKIVLNPVQVLHTAVNNCKPLLRLTPIKKGGHTYQVPIPISDNRSSWQSMQWLIEVSKNKDKSVKIWDQMALELLIAASNEGRAIKKKQDLHRQCESNKAFAHFRWG